MLVLLTSGFMLLQGSGDRRGRATQLSSSCEPSAGPHRFTRPRSSQDALVQHQLWARPRQALDAAGAQADGLTSLQSCPLAQERSTEHTGSQEWKALQARGDLKSGAQGASPRVREEEEKRILRHAPLPAGLHGPQVHGVVLTTELHGAGTFSAPTSPSPAVPSLSSLWYHSPGRGQL